KISAQHAAAFETLDKRKEDLLEKLNHFYQLVLEKRQEVAHLSKTKSEKFTPFSAAADNSEFMVHGRLAIKSWQGRMWGKIKKFTSRAIIFIGATETGTLIFRAVFGVVGGLVTLGLASNPLSLTTIGIIMVLIATGWGITKLCHHWSKKVITQEELFLSQSEVYIRALSCEHQYLEESRQLLTNKQSTTEHFKIPSAFSENDDASSVTATITPTFGRSPSPIPEEDEDQPLNKEEEGREGEGDGSPHPHNK
ncbi:MAG TPA: hypothetical protein VD770_03725, partial [Coxiellaceae bacterium]|nr:hypothetical protein [Coxiellaceae bacterium]